MRVFYDGQIFAVQTTGGINRYFRNLIGRLPIDFIPTVTTCRPGGNDFPIHPRLRTIYYKRFNFRPGRLSYWVEKYYFRMAAALTRQDILHPTYYSLLSREPFEKLRVPVVLTVYDMIHERFREKMDPDGAEHEKKRRAVRSARAIICISENTKKDLVERLAVDEKKITVTYLASEITVDQSYGPDPVPSRPYFLFVGSRSFHKNFQGLLDSFRKVASMRHDIALCVVGLPFSKLEERTIRDLGLEGLITNVGRVSDSHLAKLYRCSIALVYPSLYEGFGIPLLEAMSCGTPAIASNCSSIPEVVQDAALLFDPVSPNEMAEMMIHLFDSPGDRDIVIEKGFKRAKQFNWNKTVSQTTDVYRSICN